MASNLNGGFKVTARESIDTRIVLTKAQMKAEQYTPGDTTSLIAVPNNYFCVCKDDDKLYVYNSENPVDETTGRFRIASGSSISEYIATAEVDEETHKLTLKDQDDQEVVFQQKNKTLNGESIIGEGDIVTKTFNGASLIGEGNITTKTINGNSIVGEGDIAIEVNPEYHDLSGETSVKLNEKTATGVYKIANASDKPTGTSQAGTLAVTKLKDSKSEQFWYSDTNYAHRVFEGGETEPLADFYVDGVKVTPETDGTVKLTSGGNAPIHLKGTLNGQVVITARETQTKRIYTTLVLDGVKITTATDAAILSMDAENRVAIEISEGITNTLTSTATATEVSSTGCIHSESDLNISGNGKLSITSANGHGIKGSDIIFSGKPNIYIDAKHDGIHGKTLAIAEGTYYIKNSNDAFSAGSDNHSGVIKVSGGNITVEKCSENVFQSKTSTAEGEVAGRIRIFYHPTITLLEGFSTAAVNNADSIEVWDTATWVKPSATTINGVIAIASKYASTPTVYDETNRQSITADENGLFNISTAGDTYTCTGNFTGYRIEVPNAGKTLLLNGVYVNDETDNSDPFIYYHAGEGVKNVKIVFSNGATDNTLNYIRKKNGYCIKSQNNINMNKGSLGDAGDIYLSCPNGYAVYCENELRCQNDGLRYFVNSKYGIRANLINIGDELAEKTDYTGCKNTLFYACDNTEYDISLYYHTYSSVGRNGRVNVTADTYGTAYLGKVVKEVASETIEVYAEEHQVQPGDAPETADIFTRYPFVYVLNTSDTYTNVGGKVISIKSSDTSSSWKVYIADAYTKDEMDTKLNLYVLKTTYEAKITELTNSITTLNTALTALTARVSALEGNALNPEFDDETGSLSLSHTSITDTGNVDLNRSSIDDDGAVTLR